MRRWLNRFLPVVLVALAVQVIAPVAACWAAGIAASDPLVAAAICHGNGGAGASQDEQSGPQEVEKSCCGLCGMLQTWTPVDSLRAATAVAFDTRITAVAWHEYALDPATSRAGSPEQARAPPTFS